MPSENLIDKDVKTDLQPGEKVFTLFLFVTCSFMFYQSILLLKEHPGISGPAVLPMLASGLPALLLFGSIIGNVKKKTLLNIRSLNFEQKKKILKDYLFPSAIITALVFIVLYCAMLSFHVPFYIVTSLFLWGLMSLLSRRNYLKNAVWTALTMIFIAVVFGMLFSVVMP